MSSAPIKVGVVGAGTNTVTHHLPGLLAIPGVEIVSVSNRSPESSGRVAERFEIPTVYRSWQELVGADDTNAIVIGTWPNLHCPATLAALSAGKHVLCEARMASSLDEARRMLDAARRRPALVAQLVPSPYSLALDRQIQRLIAGGYLGDILSVSVRDGSTFRNRSTPLSWRQDVDAVGINVLTLGVWYEALMRWVGEAHRVYAAGRTFVATRHDSEGRVRGVRVPDHVDVIADFACGAQGHIRLSAVTGFAGEPEAWLYGSQGTLRFVRGQLFGGKVGANELQALRTPAAEVGGWRVEEEFVNAIRGLEAVSYTTFGDGVKYMAFTDAVARSMANGVPMPVAL